MEEGFAFAGTTAYLTERLQSVKEIFDELIADFNRAKQLELGML